MSKSFGSSEPVVTFRFTNPSRRVTLVPRRAWIPLATTATALSLSSCGLIGGGSSDDSRLTPAPLAAGTTPAPTTQPAALAGQMQSYAERMDAAKAKQDKEKLNKLLQSNPDDPVVLAAETDHKTEASAEAGAVKPTDAAETKEPAGAARAEGVMATRAGAAAEPLRADSAGGTELATAVGPRGGGAMMPKTSAMSAMSAVSVGVGPVDAGVASAGAGTAAVGMGEPGMDGVLEAVRKRAETHPQNLNYALALQLLETAENGKAGDASGGAGGGPAVGSAADRATLSALAPVDQKLVEEIAAAVQSLAAHPAGATTTLAERAAPLVEAAKSWQTDGDLELPRLVLASRVDSFGVYNAVDPKFESGKRHVVIIYCEVANFATKKTDDGLFETHLEQQDTLVTEDGFLVWRPNPEEVEDRSRNQRKDFYLVKKLTIPETLAVGKYTLRMSVSDKVSGKNKLTLLPIEIVEGK